MANTQDIRRRIKSIRNTSQITKAMQMVAASKMRRAQQLALSGRPYSELMNRVLVSLRSRTDPLLHPLLQVRPTTKELVLVISTDKGLAGAINTNLMREAVAFDAARALYVTAGRKARQFVARSKRELLADFELRDAPTFLETKAMSRFAIEKFLSGQVDKVTVLYTHFVNTIDQKPVTQVLLPISQLAFKGARGGSQPAEPTSTDPMLGYIFEPSAHDVLDFMLPYYVQYQVYQMVLDARASEHSARMVAMKNATDNAKEFIKDLTLEYNKMRQASITTELLEIATAQRAVGS
jgi:F-type H+-transporting ATPase subunit gamma